MRVIAQTKTLMTAGINTAQSTPGSELLIF